jgi:hypothetical protein
VATIDLKDFAEACLISALQFGNNAHYLVAAAMLRSGLKDDKVDQKFGPYMLTQEEWNASRADARLKEEFAVDDVKQWDAQVIVVALKASDAFQALQNPSYIQLYQKQFPGPADAQLETKLQKACDDTKQAVLDAIDRLLPKPAQKAAAGQTVITDPTKPVAKGGGGAAGGAAKPGGG